MKKLLLVLIMGLFYSVFGQTFTDIGAALTGVSDAYSSSWGDYDNDGDLDLVIHGKNSSDVPIVIIYRNDSGNFTNINADLTGVWSGSAEWGDYDRDGDLDLFITGLTSGDIEYSKLYRNDSGTFTPLSQTFTGYYGGTAAWGDYDNDGDLDLVTCSKIYRNDNGTFVDVNGGLSTSIIGSTKWGDYDNDGDLDILLTGTTYGGTADFAIIYRNDAGTFIDINAGLIGVRYSVGSWGDYDNDGDLDILLTGETGGFGFSRIYRNDSGAFTNINASLSGVAYSCSAWGDFDNDGDLDIILSGWTTAPFTKIYRNNAGSFAYFTSSITNLYCGSCAWGDYDNDNDLDVIVTGDSGTTTVSKIYRNNSTVANSIPNCPTNLSASVSGNDVVFTWDKTTDAETPQSGLSYNLYIGTTSQTCGVISPMSNLASGYRKIVCFGNANQINSLRVKNLPEGTYFWSVQAIDHAFEGSSFTSENSFRVLSPPLALSASNITSSGFSANWNAVTGATGYRLDVDDDNDFSSLLTGYNDLDVGNVNSFEVANLSVETSYYYRLKAYNESGITEYSNVISLNTLSRFTALDSGIPGVFRPASVWGDYDNDGDLDILHTGTQGVTGFSNIYRNDSGIFSDINAGLTGVRAGAADWGDFDNDNDLDFVISGLAVNETYITEIYRNDSGNFVDINAGLNGVANGSADWGDYDNDGDLDLLLTGSLTSKIYSNNNGVFTDINAGLEGLDWSTASWCDYDSDGDLDILMSGDNGDYMMTDIYRNDDQNFTRLNAGLLPLNYCSADWGDYDNDGDSDILISGWYYGFVSKIYRNDSGTFSDINAGLTGNWWSFVKWGDYDNDGNLDVTIAGNDSTKIYRNNSGIFSEIETNMPSYQDGSGGWGDYDNDGDLDLFLTGTGITSLYRNNSSIPNSAPSIPTYLTSSVDNNDVTFAWTKSTDTETTQDGLSYNIYVKKDSKIIKSPMSNFYDGSRKCVSTGNINQVSTWTIKDLAPGTYQWSLQSVDHSFTGSDFASERSFTILGVPQNVNINYNGSTVNISWQAVTSATAYRIYGCDNPYGTFIDISKQGSFNSATSWSKLTTSTMSYYYVVAFIAGK